MPDYETGNHPLHTWFSCKSKPVDMLGHKEVKVYQGRFAFLKPNKGEKGDKYIDLHSLKEFQKARAQKMEKQRKEKAKKEKEIAPPPPPPLPPDDKGKNKKD